MYRFEDINSLWLLLAPLVLMLLFMGYMRQRKGRLINIAQERLLPIIIPSLSINKPLTKFVIVLISFILIIIAFANPQGGKSIQKEVNSAGIDVFFVLDISNSMLAEDVKPSRLERAKQFIYSLLDDMGNDRVGLILVAGDSYIQLPLTTDHAAMRMFVQSSTTDLIDPQGTNLAKALTHVLDANERLKSSGMSIVLLSDGENFEDDPMPLVEQCAEKNIVINTVAMGTTNGAPIPILTRGVMTGVKKDEEGNTVITKPNQELLKKIAETTTGVYVGPDHLANGPDDILASFEKIAQSERDTQKYSDYESYYLLFAIPALLLLILDMFIREKRMAWQDKFRTLIENDKR